MKASKKPMTITEFAAMGGRAAAAKMTKEQRSARAKKAAKARWKRYAKKLAGLAETTGK